MYAKIKPNSVVYEQLYSITRNLNRLEAVLLYKKVQVERPNRYTRQAVASLLRNTEEFRYLQRIPLAILSENIFTKRSGNEVRFRSGIFSINKDELYLGGISMMCIIEEGIRYMKGAGSISLYCEGGDLIAYNSTSVDSLTSAQIVNMITEGTESG